jgi:hypothetical protein
MRSRQVNKVLQLRLLALLLTLLALIGSGIGFLFFSYENAEPLYMVSAIFFAMSLFCLFHRFQN